MSVLSACVCTSAKTINYFHTREDIDIEFQYKWLYIYIHVQSYGQKYRPSTFITDFEMKFEHEWYTHEQFWSKKYNARLHYPLSMNFWAWIQHLSLSEHQQNFSFQSLDCQSLLFRNLNGTGMFKCTCNVNIPFVFPQAEVFLQQTTNRHSIKMMPMMSPNVERYLSTLESDSGVSSAASPMSPRPVS
jgi:hypothetical protein